MLIMSINSQPLMVEANLLEVRLLGAFEVERGGIVVEIPSHPAKLLLAYLALAAGTPQPRERIAGILWPESDEVSSRGNLRQALWRLRKAIGAGCLPSDNNTIAFESGAECQLDIALLVGPTDGDLAAAVSAYQGELLPGFYEDWVLLERERLRATFDSKIQRLLTLLQEEQKWPEILSWAEYWIALGQVPEPAYRSLMIAHAARGDLAAVARTYDRCVSALRLEVGVDPSEETRVLYNRLLQGEWSSEPDRVEPALIAAMPGPRNNLPQHSTLFIGRDRELDEAVQLLSSNRLLTILGPGGMGKTRMALRVAEEIAGQFHNGAHFVSLESIESANYLIRTIAEAIGFPLSTDELLKSQLLRHLRNRQYLLLLDNFEHLLDGARLVAEILRAAGNVVILTTSRERLNLQEESLLRIEGLAYPRSSTDPEGPEYDAVQLFVSSARRLRPGFVLGREEVEEVTRICQMVQGMPLAILLAAAWIDMLSPGEIAEEMSRSLDFLQTEWRDEPERHRSVRAAIESSWRLLTKPQRELLTKLAVFRGGFTLDAAHEVAKQFAYDNPADVAEQVSDNYSLDDSSDVEKI